MAQRSEYRSFDTMVEYFYHWESTRPDDVWLKQPVGDDYITYTWREAGYQARSIVTALRSMGLKEGDHVGILSKNCSHWFMADVVCHMGGFVSVPYYPTLPGDQLSHVIEASDIKALFVGKLDTWDDRADAVPDDVQIVSFPRHTYSAPVTEGLSWDALVAEHEAMEGNPTPDPDSIWSILYTSGTTGQPKGAMHYHRAPAAILSDEMKTDFLGVFSHADHKVMSYLPLNHIAARITDITFSLGTGAVTYFAENLDTFPSNLAAAQPTIFFAVPRIWTRYYQTVTQKIPERTLRRLLKVPGVSKVVKARLKTAMGMRDTVIYGTGAAITPSHIKEFFGLLDAHLIEGYGATETCGGICSGPSLDTPRDSVGVAYPGCEIAIEPDTGEILMKTPYLMAGYYKAQELTDSVVKDGWYHSGDKGTKDASGYVRVIGRVKDTFKTAKGEFITPNPMEEVLSKNDHVEVVAVMGIGIPQPIAVVNLSEAGQAADRMTVVASLAESLEGLNRDLVSHLKVSTIVVDTEAWSEENDMLTPTLKTKRHNIDAKYQNRYQEWHDDAEQILWI